MNTSEAILAAADARKEGLLGKYPLAAQVLAEELMKLRKPDCTWEPDEDAFQTTCGNAFVLIDGDPRDNGISYCPYCGGRLVSPNAKVSGAGTASAGLPGYTAGENTE